ncbi:hypothetical protein HYU18_00485 [Candidatus Woesearchaeota archaeon]|nr:hypothetical protein [Candidatus Woesearchaeota archaeon]
MAQLTQHDRDLGIQPVDSIDGLVSQEAKALAGRFGITLEMIPGLRKLQHDYGQAIQIGTAPQEVMARKGLILAATALMLYESAARKAPFKLVIPGQSGVDTELYDHVLNVTPTDAAFARLYEGKAMQAQSTA